MSMQSARTHSRGTGPGTHADAWGFGLRRCAGEGRPTSRCANTSREDSRGQCHHTVVSFRHRPAPIVFRSKPITDSGSRPITFRQSTGIMRFVRCEGAGHDAGYPLAMTSSHLLQGGRQWLSGGYLRKIHSTVRLFFEAGLSIRAIARSLQVSPSTAGEHQCAGPHHRLGRSRPRRRRVAGRRELGVSRTCMEAASHGA